MPKINRGYQSLFEYLVIKDFPFARNLDERFYPDENSRLKYLNDAPYGRRWNPRPHRGQQILGGLQPVADMAKDYIDMFKPYKSAYYPRRDFLQPIRGLGNVAKGVGNLLGAPLLLFGNTIRYAFLSGSLSRFAKNMMLNFHRTVSWLLDGVSSFVQGTTQIATTPLVWIIKMPLRGLITAIEGKPRIKQNDSIQKLVSEGKKAVEEGSVVHLDAIRYELHRKYKKFTKRDQKTNIPDKKEKELFKCQYFKYGRNYEYPLRKDRATAALQYIGLFSTNPQEQQRSLTDKAIKSCGWTTLQAYEKEQERIANQRTPGATPGF